MDYESHNEAELRDMARLEYRTELPSSMNYAGIVAWFRERDDNAITTAQGEEIFEEEQNREPVEERVQSPTTIDPSTLPREAQVSGSGSLLSRLTASAHSAIGQVAPVQTTSPAPINPRASFQPTAPAPKPVSPRAPVVPVSPRGPTISPASQPVSPRGPTVTRGPSAVPSLAPLRTSAQPSIAPAGAATTQTGTQSTVFTPTNRPITPSRVPPSAPRATSPRTNATFTVRPATVPAMVPSQAGPSLPEVTTSAPITVNPPVITPANVALVELPRTGARMPRLTQQSPRVTARAPVATPSAGGAVVTQQPAASAAQIDPSRLEAGRPKKGSNAYTVPELKDFARQLGLRVTGNKQELVDRITERLIQLGQM